MKISLLTETDIPLLEAAFESFYAKPASTFEQYLQENDRKVWVAYYEVVVAGYITLKLNSKYPYFAANHIPEIMDLNVIPTYRNKGIATKLLDIAEEEAAKTTSIIGLGVGLYKDYGSAQKLYIKRGYMPDGNGITYDYKQITPGSMVCLDDDLVLWMTKRIK